MNITVNQATTVGTLAGDITVCKATSPTTNTATFTYTVGTSNGAVVRWEEQVGSSSWSTINNTSNTLTVTNIVNTTKYRVVVKNGACSELASASVTATVQELPVASVSGSSTICAFASGSIHTGVTTVPVTVTNVVAGQRSLLKYLEGTTSKGLTIFGTSGTITTSALTTNTDISLVSIQSFDSVALTATGCSNGTLTSTVTINVNPLPTVSLNSVGGPICSGSTTTYSITVSNVASTQGWSVSGTINDGTAVVALSGVSGTGSGTTPR